MIYAILDGGDWADASVDHLVVPDSMDIEKESVDWRVWYNKIYLPSLHVKGSLSYINFTEWLISKGAREPNDDELIEFWVP